MIGRLSPMSGPFLFLFFPIPLRPLFTGWRLLQDPPLGQSVNYKVSLRIRDGSSYSLFPPIPFPRKLILVPSLLFFSLWLSFLVICPSSGEWAVGVGDVLSYFRLCALFFSGQPATILQS